MQRCVLFSALLLLLGACSPLHFSSTAPNSQVTQGSVDKEVSPGVFVIEINQPLPWYSKNSQEQHLLALQKSWQQRANELCQYGYQGSPEIIVLADARLQDFQCHSHQCNQHLMVSGIAWCHKRYQL